MIQGFSLRFKSTSTVYNFKIWLKLLQAETIFLTIISNIFKLYDSFLLIQNLHHRYLIDEYLEASQNVSLYLGAVSRHPFLQNISILDI